MATLHDAERRLLNTLQAASYLAIGKRTLQERVAGREIAFVKMGKILRFDRADLDAYIDKHKSRAAGWKGGAQ